MNEGLYEIIALGARYAFAALMLAIVIRAWRITLIDSRRAARLRRWSPETGVVGEFQVVSGDQGAKKGMVYPVIREGLLGRGGRADVRLRSRSVRRRHAYFEMTDEGLLVRAAGAASVGGAGRTAVLLDGDTLKVGRVKLLLVLTQPEAAQTAPEDAEREADPESLFDAADGMAAGAFDPEGNFAPRGETDDPLDTEDSDDSDDPFDADDAYDDEAINGSDGDDAADEALYAGRSPKRAQAGEEWWPRGQ